MICCFRQSNSLRFDRTSASGQTSFYYTYKRMWPRTAKGGRRVVGWAERGIGAARRDKRQARLVWSRDDYDDDDDEGEGYWHLVVCMRLSSLVLRVSLAFVSLFFFRVNCSMWSFCVERVYLVIQITKITKSSVL